MKRALLATAAVAGLSLAAMSLAGFVNAAMLLIDATSFPGSHRRFWNLVVLLCP